MHVFHQNGHLVTIVLFCLGFFIGCGGSDSAERPPSTTEDEYTPSQINMAGTWQVEETVNGNCSGTEYPYTRIKIYTGFQAGDSVTFTDTLEDEKITGTLNGNTLKFNTTRPDGDGTLTILGILTFADDALSLSGTSQWTYHENGYACRGTHQFTGTKNNDAWFNASGKWSGIYESSRYDLSDTFYATIKDNAGNLTGTIDIPGIGMVEAQLKGIVDGSELIPVSFVV